MGITKLWADLRQAGLIVELNGKEHEVQIAHEVDGMSVAIDVSIWIFQVGFLFRVGYNCPGQNSLCKMWLRPVKDKTRYPDAAHS